MKTERKKDKITVSFTSKNKNKEKHEWVKSCFPKKKNYAWKRIDNAYVNEHIDK